MEHDRGPQRPPCPGRVARDAAGNTATSTSVTVTVANADTEPITPITVGYNPIAVAVTDTHAYVRQLRAITQCR